MSPLFAFGFTGHWEILIIAGVVLLLFGNRLPGVMRSMGRGIVEFKKGVQGIEDKSEDASSDPKTVTEDTVQAGESK
ncbi:MAG: twin-arginine translocase TatA/TatE family subunit [Pirellulales bacterium]|nr:twin-arginine translocase TatA/TatE family subunit [Pirellulales bacterium]